MYNKFYLFVTWQTCIFPLAPAAFKVRLVLVKCHLDLGRCCTVCFRDSLHGRSECRDECVVGVDTAQVLHSDCAPTVFGRGAGAVRPDAVRIVRHEGDRDLLRGRGADAAVAECMQRPRNLERVRARGRLRHSKDEPAAHWFRAPLLVAALGLDVRLQGEAVHVLEARLRAEKKGSHLGS